MAAKEGIIPVNYSCLLFIRGCETASPMEAMSRVGKDVQLFTLESRPRLFNGSV